MKVKTKVKIILLCLLSFLLVSCGSKNGYKENFANKNYAHLFTQEDKEYYSGSSANVIMFKEDKVIVSEMVESEMYKTKKNKSESGPQFYLDEKEYTSPTYDKEKKEIKAEGLEDSIKVKENGEIEYKGKTYSEDAK
ncbi:hypothetical protein [Lagierella sp.]|uniref:hypothetical protein n=1 Tax=Lagierella sp. TaxID=2849657 RepID=UPI002605E08B|nr:hypothetical protein [Lagierella sp.]